MSNPDKHKPLSPEELFKLLDSQSSKSSDFDELDDFEKEALEGFSAHSDSQKAKTLTEELNIAISKKVTPTGSANKNKVIWFSAAASIALILMISIFFFNQTKEDSATNIALNEEKANNLPQQQFEEAKPIESITDNLSKEQNDASEAPLTSQQTIVSKNSVSESNKGLVTESPVVLAGAKPELSYNTQAKDEAKSRSDANLDDKLAEGDVAGEKPKTIDVYAASGVASSSVAKEKNKLEQEQSNNEMQANQKIAANTSATKTVKEEGYYKADESIAQADSKKKAEKADKLSKESDDMDKANAGPGANRNAASAPVSITDNKTSSAYYVGSEVAIRDYVTSYFKEKTIAASLSGKYKVTGTVDNKGHLKVTTISEIGKDNCGCKEDIKKALNSMTKWISATEGAKYVPSNVEFILVF